MYFLYCRLDIDAIWFKLEATTPFELGTSAIDSTCLTWWLQYTKTYLCFILTHPPCSYQLTQLKYSLIRLGTDSENPTGSPFGWQGHYLHQPTSQHCCDYLRPSQQHLFLPIRLFLLSCFVGRLRNFLSDTHLSQLDLFRSYTSFINFATFRDRVLSIVLNSWLVLASLQDQSPTNWPFNIILEMGQVLT